jgi:hypothetical protein
MTCVDARVTSARPASAPAPSPAAAAAPPCCCGAFGSRTSIFTFVTPSTPPPPPAPRAPACPDPPASAGTGTGPRRRRIDLDVLHVAAATTSWPRAVVTCCSAARTARQVCPSSVIRPFNGTAGTRPGAGRHNLIAFAPAHNARMPLTSGHRHHDAPLDPLLQRQRRDRTRPARADQPELHDAVVLVEVDELDVAAVRAQRRPDRLQHVLDLLPRVRTISMTASPGTGEP